jgi:hypothetical protein
VVQVLRIFAARNIFLKAVLMVEMEVAEVTLS